MNLIMTVNGNTVDVSVEQDMPLLWILRDILNLTGTKYGCGRGYCGACVVHVNGRPVRSCLLSANSAQDSEVLTIEGLATRDVGRALSEQWQRERVPQCGFCQSGQLMSAAALLESNRHPKEDEIYTAMSGVLCRCGTYPRIKRAIQAAVKK